MAGDLNLTAVKPLLQKYLANLPARVERENFADEGVRAIADERVFKRSYQATQRSDAAMIIKNEKAKYLRSQLLRINALSAVLSMILREDRAGVHMNLAKYPYESFVAHFGFTAAPDNVNAVLGEIKSNVAELKGGADIKRYLQIQKIGARKNAPILRSGRVLDARAHARAGFWR